MKKILFIGLFLLALLVNGWEAPVKIDGGEGFLCELPTVVRFDYSGFAYVLYVVDPFDLRFAKYDGEKVHALGKVNSPGKKPYTPHMFIARSGKIHIVWAEAVTRTANEYDIMYRTFEDNAWSKAVQLVALHIPGIPGSKHAPPKVDFLKIGVDSNENLFLVYFNQVSAKCGYISKYGNVIKQEDWPGQAKRMKFPDIAVSDNYIDVVWQHDLSRSDNNYTSMWARRKNKANSQWQPTVDLKRGNNYTHSSHNPIIALDDQKNPHFIYMDDGRESGGREIIYNYWTGTALANPEREFLTPNAAAWSNNCISMFNKDNGFLVSHLNKLVYYYWKVNGVWTGVSVVPGTGGADNEWSDLSKDGKVAIVSYTLGFNSVWVSTSSKIETNSPPKAVITVDNDEPFWQDTVNFSGSNSTDSDGYIANYDWDFGDGDKDKGRQVAHTFVKKYGDIKITLTVTDNKGLTATASKTINVKALYTAKDLTYEKKLIRTLLYSKNGYVLHWSPNEKNAGFNIIAYKILRRVAGDTGDYTEVAQVNAAETLYIDMGIEQTGNNEYTYSVCSLDDQGHLSPVDNN